jgi:hypothetical protein
MDLYCVILRPKSLLNPEVLFAHEALLPQSSHSQQSDTNRIERQPSVARHRY